MQAFLVHPLKDVLPHLPRNEERQKKLTELDVSKIRFSSKIFKTT